MNNKIYLWACMLLLLVLPVFATDEIIVQGQDDNADVYWDTYENRYHGTTFTTGNYTSTITNLQIKARRGAETLDSPVNFSIYAVNSSNLPTGTYLSTGVMSQEDFNPPPDMAFENITMSSYVLSPNTNYSIFATFIGGNATTVFRWGRNAAGSYTGGNSILSSDGGVVWTHYPASDHTFELWGFKRNKVDLTFKDEFTDTLVSNVSYAFWSSTYSFNGTTTTGEADLTNIEDTTYRIDYTPTDYEQRSYYLTVVNDTHTNLTLYCINESEGELITVNVQDETGIELTGYYVKALRQFINGSEWRVVEIGQTNYDGQTLLSLKKYTVPYAFIVQNTDGSVTQYFAESFIAFNEVTLSVDTQENVISSWSRLDQIVYSLTRSGVGGKNITLVWSDTTNSLLDEICLRVEQRLASTNLLLSEECSSSTSGLLNYTIIASSGSFIISIPYETTTQYSTGFLDYLVITISEFLQAAGPLGLFMALILTATIGVLYAYNPVLAIFGGIGGLFLSMALGLNVGMITLFSILTVVGLIIAFKVRA